MANEHSSGNIRWHPAFFEAIQLELAAYRNVLEFIYDYQLTTDPLRIDTLIIKKPKQVKIEKNFAQIFRGNNICEFKSPGDYLAVKDFYKVMAYACQYVADGEGVDIDDITLTFVVTKYPRELIKHLKEVCGYSVDEPWPGIHRVSGDFIPIQILESKKLSESDNMWLKGLNTGLEISNARLIFKEGAQKEDGLSKRAYLYAVLQANPLVFEEVYKMDSTVTLDDVLMNLGLVSKWEEEGREKGREEGRMEGRVETLHEVLELLKQGYQAEQIEAKLSAKTE
ncbi:hypothetical protein AGMMS49940_21090 [Spirochaetia bacterium]|nr:hypothetical protein AGMMS49940_21090 [Spirochaetia bacterium]